MTSNFITDRLLSVLTSKSWSGGSLTSWMCLGLESTESRMEPLNSVILASRRSTVVPGASSFTVNANVNEMRGDDIYLT